MFYKFPEIAHIQQVHNAIKGDEDKFIISDRGEFISINYKIPDNSTFPSVSNINSAIRRELRGIKFYSDTGLIAQRLMTKFFNYSEREETLQHNVDLSKNHIVLEKLDGSLLAPIKLSGGIRWTTKACISDVAMQVEEHLASGKNLGISEYVIDAINDRYTPMFEWLSIKNKVVLHHEIDRLVLIAVRNNFTGNYLTHDQMMRIGRVYDFEVVKKLSESQIEDIAKHAEKVYKHEGELTEGQIIRFEPSGHMLKIKTEKYVNLHKTKEKIQKEQNFVAVILDETLDDLKSFMSKEDKERADIYLEEFSKAVNVKAEEIYSEILVNEILETPRKDFALKTTLEPISKSIIFHFWETKVYRDDIYNELIKRLKQACQSPQKFEKAKQEIFPKCVW